MKAKVIAGIGSALFAGVMLLIAATTTWHQGVHDDSETTVGLRRGEICINSAGCKSLSLAEWPTSSALGSVGPPAPNSVERYRWIGLVAFGLALLTVASIVLLVGTSLRPSYLHLPFHPSNVVLFLSIALLIVGGMLHALHPFDSWGWKAGPGFMCLAGGDIACVIAALILGRSADPQSAEDWFQ